MAGASTPIFLLLVGAIFVATVESGEVGFAKYSLGIGTGPIFSSGLSDVNIALTATADGSSNLKGTGLWKMSIFASKENDPNTADPLKKQDQVLDQTLQDLEVVAGKDLLFDVNAQFQLGEMGGCGGDYKYFCFVLTKGDHPNPAFNLKKGYIYSGCSTFGFKCDTAPKPTAEPIPDDQKPVVFAGTSMGLGWGYLAEGDETFKFTAKLNPSSRQNLKGTGLWRLGIFWSKTASPDTPDRFDNNDQILSESESNKSIEGGKDLVFTAKELVFKQAAQPSCGADQYSYVCVTLTKGDHANPDFDLSKKINHCYKICKE